MNSKKSFIPIVFVFIFLYGCNSAALAAVKLPAIFGDHMVLQQKNSVAVWGWADPGEKVTVKGSWQWFFGKSVKADKDGIWKVNLRTPKAGKAVSLKIKGRDNEIILNDVLLGEVWICSGQSNMQSTMKSLGTERSKADIEKANAPTIRLFTVKRVIFTTPKEDIEGTWEICTPETAATFSATGYYFGKNLHEKLNVPIGLVSTNWGGTKAEAWTSREGLKDFERFSDEIEMLTAPEQAETTAEKKDQRKIIGWEEKIAKKDDGIQQKWFSSDFDDSDWAEMDLPSVWAGTDLASVDGIVWFRRSVNLPPLGAKNEIHLHLGAIDDIDTLWINDVKVKTTIGWSKPRVYRIPASALKTEKNIIAIRVVDTAGEGGFSGQKADMRIGPAGADVKTCVAVAGKWKYKLSHKGAVPAPPVTESAIDQNTATVLYNAMIAPLTPMRIAGAIWYQGESNCYDPIGYRTLFPAMITDWRTQWDQGDFPFYFVQIAPFQYDGQKQSQAVREAQMMTLNAVDNTGMAVTMDIGEKGNIHPGNKHDVGERLARWALAKTYGYGINKMPYSGPIYEDMTAKDGKIALTFKYTHPGLVAKDGKLTGFMIAGKDRKFVPAKAEIHEYSETHGKSIIVAEWIEVWSDEVAEPVAVRYGWSNWVDGSLFNEAGLPASSFRTDDWPLE